MFKKVAEFHKTFNLLIATSPQFPNKELRELRINILDEEWKELKEAYEQRDLIEIADALADMAYLICGTSLTYGIAPSNLEFEIIYTNHINYPPRIPENTSVLIDAHNSLDAAFNRYLLAEKNNDLREVLITLQEVMLEVAELSKLYNIPLNRVFDEVHRSNMSKLDENGMPMYREDGKVMKSKLWSPPDIKSILFPE